MTLNASKSAGAKPKKLSAKTKWPEEDMGKNSVIPCRIPRVRAWRMLIGVGLRHTFVWIDTDTTLVTFVVQVDTCGSTDTTGAAHLGYWLAFGDNISWFYVEDFVVSIECFITSFVIDYNVVTISPVPSISGNFDDTIGSGPNERLACIGDIKCVVRSRIALGNSSKSWAPPRTLRGWGFLAQDV